MIKQTIYLLATPEEIYDALMDEKKHSEFTGAKAEIDPVLRGKFSVWDGYATGENLELKPGKKIVQAWRASDWPKEAVSKVIFSFFKTKDGTKLEFTHENVPQDFEKEIEQGWGDYYWEPLKKYFRSPKS